MRLYKKAYLKKLAKVYHLLGATYLISIGLVWPIIYFTAMIWGDYKIFLDFNYLRESWVEVPLFVFGVVYTVHLLMGLKTSYKHNVGIFGKDNNRIEQDGAI